MNIAEITFENETRKHQQMVAKYLTIFAIWVLKYPKFAMLLMVRATTHDNSKLEDPERKVFVVATPKLKALTYGGDEYKEALKEMGTALSHHYKVNRHHPEHFDNGVNDMTLVDVIEMLCDWLAATHRHTDGDIVKSIEINAKRFSIAPHLTKCLQHTAEFLFLEAERADLPNKECGLLGLVCVYQDFKRGTMWDWSCCMDEQIVDIINNTRQAYQVVSCGGVV